MNYITISDEVIDTDTGEVIGTVKQFNSAIEFLPVADEMVKSAVESVVSSLYTTTSVIKTAKSTTNTKGAGPKPKSTTNPFVGELDEVEVTGWLDDILTGAARLSTGNTVNNKWDLWSVVKSVASINTTSVIKWYNLRGSEVGERHARTIAAQVRSLIKSMQYHLDSGKELPYRDGFDVKQDAEMYETYGKDWYSYFGRNI